MTKYDDLLAGALTVFSSAGYTRATIAAIAEAAGVSTRTIYNWHSGKAELFHATIQYSTRIVADRNIAIVQESTRSVGLVDAVLSLARSFAVKDKRFAEHYALVRQVQAERSYIPQETLDVWTSMGPVRVRSELESELRRLFCEEGCLLNDPAASAEVLLLLIDGDPVSRGFYRSDPYPATYLESLAVRGALVFLSAYAPEVLSRSGRSAMWTETDIHTVSRTL